MNSRIVIKVVLALVLVAAILGLGAYAYRVGMMQGMALSAQAPAGEAVQPAVPYYPMYYGHPFHGFGFLGCLIPFFLIFLVFFAFRGLFWGGRPHWGYMHHGPWGRGEPGTPPPMFSEWHRQAHAQPPSSAEEK